MVLSEIHKVLCLIARKRCLLKKLVTDHFGLTSKVLFQDVITLSGTYVHDLLTTGPPRVVQDFLDTLRRIFPLLLT